MRDEGKCYSNDHSSLRLVSLIVSLFVNTSQQNSGMNKNTSLERELVEPGLGRLDDWTPKTWTNLGNFVQSVDYFGQSLDFAL